jgi:hypothetical protein
MFAVLPRAGHFFALRFAHELRLPRGFGAGQGRNAQRFRSLTY